MISVFTLGTFSFGGAGFSSSKLITFPFELMTFLVSSVTISINSSLNWLASYSPFSILRSLDSHSPVSSGLLRTSSSIVSIKSIPIEVATRFFFLRSMYFLRNKVSMILARVEGLPMPLFLSISRSSSSSTCFPAVSIALSKVASV